MTSIKITNLEETHSLYQRQKQEKEILSKLESAFTSIISTQSTINNDEVKHIELSEAFKISNSQNKPTRIYKIKSTLGAMKKNKEILYNVGMNDDENEYFIFDHYNKLISDDTNNDNICFLLYNDHNKHKNVHF